jgi:hypothetical protein
MDVKKQLAARADKFHEAIASGLFGMPSKDLQKLRSAAKRLTSSNCWWAAYRMAPHLIHEIDQQLSIRRVVRKKKQPRSGAEKQ